MLPPRYFCGFSFGVPSLELNGLWISPGRLEIWELDCSIGGKAEMGQMLYYQESLLFHVQPVSSLSRNDC